MSWNLWWALFVFLAAGGLSFGGRIVARARAQDGDDGGFWTKLAFGFGVFFGTLLILSGMLETIVPQLYRLGYHLHFDLTRVFGWSDGTCFAWALALPFALCVPFSLFTLLAPADREHARWLAGAIGFLESRRWVLWLSLPLLALVVLTQGRLAQGEHGYPAAAWATLTVLFWCLVWLALSGGARAAVEAQQPLPNGGPEKAPRPWPEALRASGVDLTTLAVTAAGGPARPVAGDAAREIGRYLERFGNRGIAPELVEALARLLDPDHPPTDYGPAQLVFAPDDAGQLELVAAGAALLDQRFHATALVVTARGAAELAERLDPWLPLGGRSAVIHPTRAVPREALVWVVDAEALSDRLLPLLTDSLLINRIGMVVWWHLEDFTGVLGANLWAISRRLHRLIRLRGRQDDVRTLAFMRNLPHGDAQAYEFVQRLLPHRLAAQHVTWVERRFARRLHLHRLDALRQTPQTTELPADLRHLPLAAARASVEAGWATRLDAPPYVAEVELAKLRQLPSGGTVLGERLERDGAVAGARIFQADAASVLSLFEMVCQGGRAADAERGVHVGLLAALNPYVAYLVDRLAGRDGVASAFPTSRRLVCAEAHRDIFRRHLLLALYEHPDTRSGLLRNFFWNEEVIRDTLDRIAHEGKLTREEVRFLGPGKRLVIDHEYTSTSLPSDRRRPLDTVGVSELVEVRERAGGGQAEGVRMLVDPERLTVQAYPYRVFFHEGRRYQIRKWDSLDDVIGPGRFVECVQESSHSFTWRIRNSFVHNLEPVGAANTLGRGRRLLTRLMVDLRYEEEVTGVLSLTPDLATGAAAVPEPTSLDETISQSFATRGLVLRVAERVEPATLYSLSQALRHVLPVHLGVEEDALEVVPLADEWIDGMETYGVVIVDLYPGGIGLIDAFHDDNDFILKLLAWTRAWLEAASGDDCLRTPAALAASRTYPPQRSAALKLLAELV